jgi:hypothetical protein
MTYVKIVSEMDASSIAQKLPLVNWRRRLIDRKDWTFLKIFTIFCSCLRIILKNKMTKITSNSFDKPFWLKSFALSIWESFLGLGKTLFGITQEIMDEFTATYPSIPEMIQLSCIYFCAIIDLFHSILSNVFSLGYFPEILKPFFPLIKEILTSPVLRIWASPEKVFFLSYLVIEFMVVRSVFKFSKLIRYNILLIFSLLMVQGLVISYWDLLFHREVATSVARWTYDQGVIVHTDKSLGIFFFLNTFLIFMVLYCYLYFQALNGKFASPYGMEWLTDSVAFWLRIKTPNMRFGKRKKKE